MTETINESKFYHFKYDGDTKKTKDLTNYFYHEWCDEADNWRK